ncbi:PTS transporter subunit EIIC [Enterococcus thailandicus]|uniref:PTS transporter subunit EIIC n=1 Tax=Enterococcus thailandicus TaxID=417368 RepID=UPI00398513A4
MNYKKTAEDILKNIGGEDNIEALTHCITRLRFTLKDESGPNDEEIKKIPGVMGVVRQGGQYQVVIGPEVDKVFKEISVDEATQNHESNTNNNQDPKKENVFSKILDIISSCMSPVIPAIIGSAMVKVILTLLPMVGLLNKNGSTYAMLQFISDGAFYFLPVLIAIAAANKFKTNIYYAATLALIVLLPSFTEYMNVASEANQTVKLFAVLPVTHATYAYSVVPIILGVWFLSYVEKFADKYIPGWTKTFLKPVFIILITGIVFTVVIGPLGAILGQGMNNVVQFIFDKLGFVAVGLLAAIYPFLVMAGMHYAFNPVRLNLLGTVGFDGFIGISELCSNIAQGSASLAVFFRTKNKEIKQVSGSSALSALIGGITEPALYGISVKYKTPLYGACIGGLSAGLVGGILQVKQYAFGSASLMGIPLFIDGTTSSLIHLIIMLAVDIIVTFVATWLLWKEER